ncbi:hypothetical protein EON76_01005 [bacterium]|nr:MAG: hypothetical protein EON76_01005 [bacterium]
MKVLHDKDSSEARLQLNCIVRDYGTEENVNSARVSIAQGDYPYDHYSVNTTVTLTVAVESGSGKIVVKDGDIYALKSGDVVSIPAMMPYRYIQCQGLEAVLFSSHPAWTTDQYKEISL